MAQSDHNYDVIVIGAGPAGYTAALRCAQRGLHTVCIERWRGSRDASVLGGTCLNVGCIPSKALLDSSHKYHDACTGLAAHGIKIPQLSLDLEVMQQRKAQVVSRLGKGVAGLLRAAKVEVLGGRGRLLARHEVEFTPHKGAAQRLHAKHIILAAGSAPVELATAPFDGATIVDSSAALEFSAVPKRLGVVGAGAIGLELGSVWARLGSQVLVLEALEELLPNVDREISAQAGKLLRTQGLDMRFGVRVTAATVKGSGSKSKVLVQYTDSKGATCEEQFDKLIVAVGRQAASDGLLAGDSGVQVDDRGFVCVDDYCCTEVPGVYAVGDLVRGPMLAHKGAEEGVMVAERIAGEQVAVNYDLIPGVVYTHPEIAWVGKTEEQLQAANVDYTAGCFPFAANGRALAAAESDGLVKVLADRASDRILGCHIIGPAAADILQQGVIAMEFAASAEDIGLTMFSHPAFSEAFHEAALAARGQAIHLPGSSGARSGNSGNSGNSGKKKKGAAGAKKQ